MQEGDTTIQVPLSAGEEIVSVLARTNEFGFYQFALTSGDPATIEASAALTGDIQLSVLIHIP